MEKRIVEIRNVSKWRRLALMLLVVAAGAGAAHAQQARRADTELPEKVVVAALPFTDASPQKKYAPLAQAMGDMLVSFLSKAEGLVFVERTALDKVFAEQKLSLKLGSAMDDRTKAKVGQLLGAKYILTGGVTVLDEKLRINAHLFEVETTRVARSEQADGKVDDLVKPVADLAVRLSRDLNLKLPPIKEEDIDKAPVANLHFMRGLGYYYGNMRDHAIAEFMKALALKPDHARARYWNGRCYFDDNEYEHAKIEFERFVEQFPKHERVAEIKEWVKRCAAEIKKRAAEKRP